jgi:hypothetical protein
MNTKLIDSMINYRKQMVEYLKKLEEKRKNDYDDGDVTDASTYRDIRYMKQIKNLKKDIRTWTFLIANRILVIKPGNRRVTIIHPKSKNKIHYSSISNKAQIKKHGWVRMSLISLKHWYFNREDIYKIKI